MNVELFQGLDVRVFKALQSEDPELIAHEFARSGRSFDQAVGDKAPQPVVSTLHGGVLTVKSAGPDGTLLEVRVSEP